MTVTTLKGKVTTTFPARVQAVAPLIMTSNGGSYSFSIDASALADLVTGPPTPPTVIDKGTINTGTVTFDVSASAKQKLTVGGALTVAFSNWPAAGLYGDVEIELVNAGTNITWPAITWLRGDGTNTPAFASSGVTLNSVGTNFVIVWSSNAGVTLYGKAS
jgi:hypothetical protein